MLPESRADASCARSSSAALRAWETSDSSCDTASRAMRRSSSPLPALARAPASSAVALAAAADALCADAVAAAALAHTLAAQAATCEELLEVEPDAKWPLLTLTRLRQLLKNRSGSCVSRYCLAPALP